MHTPVCEQFSYISANKHEETKLNRNQTSKFSEKIKDFFLCVLLFHNIYSPMISIMVCMNVHCKYVQVGKKERCLACICKKNHFFVFLNTQLHKNLLVFCRFTKSSSTVLLILWSTESASFITWAKPFLHPEVIRYSPLHKQKFLPSFFPRLLLMKINWLSFCSCFAAARPHLCKQNTRVDAMKEVNFNIL